MRSEAHRLFMLHLNACFEDTEHAGKSLNNDVLVVFVPFVVKFNCNS